MTPNRVARQARSSSAAHRRPGPPPDDTCESSSVRAISKAPFSVRRGPGRDRRRRRRRGGPRTKCLRYHRAYATGPRPGAAAGDRGHWSAGPTCAGSSRWVGLFVRGYELATPPEPRARTPGAPLRAGKPMQKDGAHCGRDGSHAAVTRCHKTAPSRTSIRPTAGSRAAPGVGRRHAVPARGFPGSAALLDAAPRCRLGRPRLVGEGDRRADHGLVHEGCAGQRSRARRTARRSAGARCTGPSPRQAALTLTPAATVGAGEAIEPRRATTALLTPGLPATLDDQEAGRGGNAMEIHRRQTREIQRQKKKCRKLGQTLLQVFEASRIGD